MLIIIVASQPIITMKTIKMKMKISTQILIEMMVSKYIYLYIYILFIVYFIKDSNSIKNRCSIFVDNILTSTFKSKNNYKIKFK